MPLLVYDHCATASRGSLSGTEEKWLLTHTLIVPIRASTMAFGCLEIGVFGSQGMVVITSRCLWATGHPAPLIYYITEVVSLFGSRLDKARQ
jgi:hypothetical protein